MFHQRIELIRGGVGDRRMQAGAGVVDQRIELGALPTGQHVFELRSEVGKRGHICGIELQGMRAAAQLLDVGHHRGRVVGLAVIGQHDVVAGGGQCVCGVAAQAAAAAGDQGDGRGAVHAVLRE